MSDLKLAFRTPRSFVNAVLLIVSGLLALAVGFTANAQVVEGQALDANGAPLYRVDPFWPKSLPNNWSMQQVTGIGVDDQDLVWFLNRPNAPDPLEIIAESEAIGRRPGTPWWMWRRRGERTPCPTL